MRRPAGEDGVYAILYGILLLSILGVAALVVDLGALRESRRDTRRAADAAAIYGARDLDVVSGVINPFQACTDAWGYLASNLDVPVPASTGCSTFPSSSSVCPTVKSTATATSGDYTVTITWPVLDTDPLMTKPNVRPGNVTQAVDTSIDGSNACARIGVTVAQVNSPAFAGVFGTGDVTTTTSSVARSASKPGGEGVFAALNVLEQNDCDAVVTTGQGFIEVQPTVDTSVTPPKILPGIVAIESAGKTNCGSNNPYVLDVAKNSSGSYVRADGTVVGDGKGTIEMWALQPSANPTQAYQASIAGTLLKPTPTTMAERFGDSPVRLLYDASPSYISQLKAAFGGSGVPTAYAASQYTGGFSTLPGAAMPTFPANCKVGNGTSLLVPAGNWFVNCDTLTVQGNLVFAGGNVVLKGNLDVSGCFGVNVPLLLPGCPVIASGVLATPPLKEGLFYLRGSTNLGSCTTPCLSKSSQGTIVLARTATYLAGNGQVSVTGGGSGKLYWTNPLPDTSTCDSTCQKQRFGKISLWTESTNDQNLGGQSDLVIRGVMFMPKAKFFFKGGTSINQTSAQYWAKKMDISGQSGLRMAPDPNSSVPRPELGTVLIR